LLFEFADPRLQLVALGEQRGELLLPLIELGLKLCLARQLLGEIGFGLAEPRRQGRSLRLGEMQRRHQLSDLVPLRRPGRFGAGRRRNGLLSVLTRLFEQRRDTSLRCRHVAVGGGDLVAQLRQFVLQVDIGGFDAARLNLGIVGGARMTDIADRSKNNRDDSNPGRYGGDGVDTPRADQREGTARMSNGIGRGEPPRSPVQQTAGHSPPRRARLGLFRQACHDVASQKCRHTPPQRYRA
jgi:hypothetical protein